MVRRWPWGAQNDLEGDSDVDGVDIYIDSDLRSQP